MDTIKEDEFTHYLENGIKVKTELENHLITYNDKGFVIKDLLENIEANLAFSNSNKTKGKIIYYKDGKKIGKYKFDDGQLIKGEITTKISFEDKNTVLHTWVINHQLMYTLKPEKDVGFYMKASHSTAIPSLLSYKDYKEIIFMFLPSDDEISLKFLLNDGTLLSELTQSQTKIEGVIVEYKIENEKIDYQVLNFIDISMDPVIYDNLTFEQMLEKVKEVKAKKQVSNKPNIQSKTGRKISGFYNLSGFEMAAKIYLLDNYYFFYSASFGAVDLEIYGTYSIKDDLLYLYPNEEQMQPYILYAHEIETANGTTFLINKTRQNNEEQLYISINNKWFQEPISSKLEEQISIELQKDETGELIFGIGHSNTEFIKLQNTFLAQGISYKNDLMLSENPYAQMRKQFSSSPLMLSDDEIITSRIDKSKRQDIDDDTIESITQFIDKNSRYPSIMVHDDKIYYKKSITTLSNEIILQDKGGQIIEVK